LSSHLKFLRNLQALLDDGGFSATYNFALLQSLADLAIEGQPDSDGSMRVQVADISEKFIQYYWRQTAPYRGSEGILRQNTGRQAAIVNLVADSRGKYDSSLLVAQNDEKHWRQLTSRVSTVIQKMPLWRLQIVAGQTKEFIYRRSESELSSIRLLPDAVASFRDMYVIITNFVRGAWVGKIQDIGYNREILGATAGLPEFLFGSDRGSLEKYKGILQGHQASRCFYCDKTIRTGELDHFIPWSRYPIDLGHNFVFAHARCNHRKSDFLAHVDHLAKWKETNLDRETDLSEAFGECGLPYDLERSKHVAIWAYQQGEAAGARVWYEGDKFVELGTEWRQIFSR
jgi:hypothetical protein